MLRSATWPYSAAMPFHLLEYDWIRFEWQIVSVLSGPTRELITRFCNIVDCDATGYWVFGFNIMVEADCMETDWIAHAWFKYDFTRYDLVKWDIPFIEPKTISLNMTTIGDWMID